ncbi:hypothetical protein ACQP00_21820 [Dactylosporangium sp. CS-047395]|uniref:hypothetical protein n=1 Tax=Dactylosporangium sp. CS-047395 TaxID=3239936 RepID=UPI003D93B49A
MTTLETHIQVPYVVAGGRIVSCDAAPVNGLQHVPAASNSRGDVVQTPWQSEAGRHLTGVAACRVVRQALNAHDRLVRDREGHNDAAWSVTW